VNRTPEYPAVRINGYHDRDDLALVRSAGLRLVADSDAIADGMAYHLHDRIEALAAENDPALLAETRASCRSNVGQLLRSFARGETIQNIVTPPEAVEYARGYVRRGLPLAALLRAYRLGQAYFWQRWEAALTETVAQANGRSPNPARLTEALAASSAWVFDYIDAVCNDLVEVYGAARENWARSPAAVRAETARHLLSGEIADARHASHLLGYELHRRRHTGLVLWQELQERAGGIAQLQRVAGEVAEALAASDSLVVLSGASELWVWCSDLAPSGIDVATALSELPSAWGVRIAVGRTAEDLAGFKQTHVEAAAAARVAVLAGEKASPVSFYDDLEVVSLLSQDLERARELVRHELGDLAKPELAAARLRETMLVLLEEGMSNSRAAKRLYVHNNTVVYRAARAQELLGHRLADRRIQVTTALMLAQTLGDAVLHVDPSSGER
jgi:DNA-binding PucR family transcriptional regulator